MEQVESTNKYINKYITKKGEIIEVENEKYHTIEKTMRFDDTKEIPQKSEDLFISYNTKFKHFDLDDWQKKDSWVLCKSNKINNNYYYVKRGNLNEWNFVRYLNEDEKQDYFKILEDIKNKFVIRLKKYYKRYNKCIYSVGYWVDR